MCVRNSEIDKEKSDLELPSIEDKVLKIAGISEDSKNNRRKFENKLKSLNINYEHELSHDEMKMCYKSIMLFNNNHTSTSPSEKLLRKQLVK